MTNPDLIQCLAYLKATFPDDFAEADVENGYEYYSGIYYQIHLFSINVRIKIDFDSPILHLEKGFISRWGYHDYIKIEIFNNALCQKPETFKNFVETIEQLKKCE